MRGRECFCRLIRKKGEPVIPAPTFYAHHPVRENVRDAENGREFPCQTCYR